MSDRPLTPEQLERIRKRSRFLSNPEAFELSMLCREVDRLTEEMDELRLLIQDELDSHTDHGARISQTEWNDRARELLERGNQG